MNILEFLIFYTFTHTKNQTELPVRLMFCSGEETQLFLGYLPTFSTFSPFFIVIITALGIILDAIFQTISRGEVSSNGQALMEDSSGNLQTWIICSDSKWTLHLVLNFLRNCSRTAKHFSEQWSKAYFQPSFCHWLEIKELFC